MTLNASKPLQLLRSPQFSTENKQIDIYIYNLRGFEILFQLPYFPSTIFFSKQRILNIVIVCVIFIVMKVSSVMTVIRQYQTLDIVILYHDHTTFGVHVKFEFQFKSYKNKSFK